MRGNWHNDVLMRRRLVVVPLIRDAAGALLLCRMPTDRGVYPGQWGLPGGGVEDGETLLEALRREVREELGLSLATATPRMFKDTVHDKLYPDGRLETLYMVFLLFDCTAESTDVRLNEEFSAHAWVPPEQLADYDLNEATVDTLSKLGLLGER
jgi:nucleoside triphosphatase